MHQLARRHRHDPALVRLLEPRAAYTDPFAGGVAANAAGMRRGVLTLGGVDPSGVEREASPSRSGGTEYFPSAAFSFWTQDNCAAAGLAGLHGAPHGTPMAPAPLLLWLGGESLEGVRSGARERASPTFMGLTRVGLEVGIFCDFLCSVLLWNASLARFLRASPKSRSQVRTAVCSAAFSCERRLLCATVELPAHGEDSRVGEPPGLEGWATRLGRARKSFRTWWPGSTRWWSI
jgi:hypothetical protein